MFSWLVFKNPLTAALSFPSWAHPYIQNLHSKSETTEVTRKYKDHILSTHIETTISSVELKKNLKGEKTCDLCGKSFTLAGGLKTHQLIHSGVKAYSCDLCGKSFARAGNLKKHQLIHSGVKPYSCDLCGKSFTQAENLKTHQLIHSGFKPYSCDLCGKSFTQAGALKTHQLIHTAHIRTLLLIQILLNIYFWLLLSL
uniref:C2H2-type domain-containing protein n=1 Tax=Oreochromis aureus TaxID=47969 RepID=A0AAZ1XG98_OREAU